MNLGGDGKQRLTENHDLDHYPTWSPDGSHIAFLSSRGHSNDIGADLYTMGADGSHVRLVSATQGGVAYVPPIWSPDGERLAFAIYEEPWPVRTALYTVRVDGIRSLSDCRYSGCFGGVWRTADPDVVVAGRGATCVCNG